MHQTKHPRPLTGIHVAKELKKFLKQRAIKFSVYGNTIVTEAQNFPRLVFKFKDNYIHVYSLMNMDFQAQFPQGNLATLFQKLITYRFITQKSLLRFIWTIQTTPFGFM